MTDEADEEAEKSSQNVKKDQLLSFKKTDRRIAGDKEALGSGHIL